MKRFRLRHAHAVLALGVVGALTLTACSRDETPAALVAAGKQDAAKNDHAAAVIRFRTALQQDPDSAETRFLLGKSLMATGDPDSAVAALTHAKDKGYPADQTLPVLARALLQQGNYKRVVADFANTKLSDPAAMADLSTSLATAWAALGDRTKADGALKGALAAVPNHPAATLLKLRLQVAEGQGTQALEGVDAVLAASPTLADAWLLKGDILSAFKADKPGSLVAYRKALEIKPDLALAHLAVVTSLASSGDVAGARAQLEKMKAALPKSPHTLLAEGTTAYAADDDGRAREAALQLLRRYPDHLSVLHLAGSVESRSGSLLAAERYFTKALQIHPGLDPSRFALAQVYIRLGQPARALDTLKPLLEAGSTDAKAHAIAGDAYQRLGDAEKAEKAYRRAAELQPDNLRFQAAIAMARLARGDAEAAISRLEGLAKGHQDTVADYALVSARMKRREFDAALRALDDMAKKGAPSAAATELRGRILLEKSDFAGARAAMEAALKIDPKYFGAVAGLAAIDVIERKPAEAMKRFEAARTEDPRNHLAAVAWAELAVKAGEPIDNIRKVLTESIKNAPSEAAPRLQLIQVLLGGRMARDAVLAAQEAAAALPGDMAVLDALGRAQLAAGHVDQATTTFRQMAGAAPSSPLPHSRLADLYRSTGNKKAAEAALRQALEIDPNLVSAQAALVRLLISDKRHDAALALAERMQKTNPQDVAGYAVEAQVHMQMQAPDRALAAYRKGLAVPDASAEVGRFYYKALVDAGKAAEADRFAATWSQRHPQDAAFEYQQAITAIQRGQIPQAEARLRKVVERRPNHVMALNNLAWALAYQKKPGGLVFAQRAIAQSPDSPALLDTLAMTLALERRLPEALSAQKRAVELEPGNAGLKLNLVKLSLQAGDKALARKELDALAALGTASPFRAEIEALRGQL